MNIIIYGNNDGTDIVKILFETLARYGGVQLFSKNKLICNIPNKSSNRVANFFVYELDTLPKLIACEGLFIFKESFKNLNKNKFPTRFVPIVDEQNLRAIKFLEKTDQVVVTYGISSKNTLSFSSLSSKDVIVSLQRYLPTRNNVIEPHEFSVKLSTPCEPNILLMICTVLLLSEIPSENGYEI